jgi:hypothetical protein
MTYADGWDHARAWLEREPRGIVERPPHLLIATRGEPIRGLRETAVTIETEFTIRAGTAQDRLRKLAAWKARGEGRWTVLFVPRELPDAALVGLPWADQVVRWPIAQLYPTT